ncbi:hypothetical protein AB0M34_06690 [Nocardia sp. NPDC050193]
MIRRLVVFGGTGDLAGRHLRPGSAALCETGRLGGEFEVVCADRKGRGDE